MVGAGAIASGIVVAELGRMARGARRHSASGTDADQWTSVPNGARALKDGVNVTESAAFSLAPAASDITANRMNLPDNLTFARFFVTINPQFTSLTAINFEKRGQVTVHFKGSNVLTIFQKLNSMIRTYH